MTQRTPDSLARWLAAEQDGRDDAAEAALLELFEALPPMDPPAGFADRVVARWNAEAAQPAPRSFRVPVWTRWLVAVGLLFAGSAPFWLPAVLVAVSAVSNLLSLAELLQAGVSGLAVAGQGLAFWAGLWQAITTATEAVISPLATPRLALALTICLIVSVASFRILRDVVSRERSWAYVDPA